MVIDPNETWGEMFYSVIRFQDPKLVPLDSLSKDFDPTKRKWHSLKSIINWRNQNFIEHYKPKEPSREECNDVERTEIIAETKDESKTV